MAAADSLSGSQFGSSPGSNSGSYPYESPWGKSLIPRSIGSQIGSPHPTWQSDYESPLSYMAGTSTSAKYAATWRKPHKVLPLSAATFGSVFQPFGNSAV